MMKRKAPKTSVYRRKKQMTRRRTRPTRVSRSSVTTHAFVRKTNLNTITGNVAYAPYQSYSSIGLNNVTNASEFSALYDQFRINYVKLQFWLRIDPGAQTAATASYPRLYWYRDLDSQIVATMSEMRERSNLKIAVLNPNRPVTIWVKPNTLAAIYAGVGSTNYKPVFAQWLDMNVQSTTHYGIKFNIDDLTNTNYKVDIETTYYFECKNTR